MTLMDAGDAVQRLRNDAAAEGAAGGTSTTASVIAGR